MVLWFAVLAVSGVAQIAEAPRVLAALNPAHAVGIFIAGKGQLLDVDLPHLRQQLEASRDYVFAAAGIEQDLFRSN